MEDPETPDEGAEIEAAPAAESGPGEAAGPVTYAHAQVATVAAEGNQ